MPTKHAGNVVPFPGVIQTRHDGRHPECQMCRDLRTPKTFVSRADNLGSLDLRKEVGKPLNLDLTFHHPREVSDVFVRKRGAFLPHGAVLNANENPNRTKTLHWAQWRKNRPL